MAKAVANKGSKKNIEKAKAVEPTSTIANGPIESQATTRVGSGATVIEPKKELSYPKFQVYLYAKGSEKGPLTHQFMKKLLGWETEKEYTERQLKKNPKAPQSDLEFGDEYTLKDEEGNKVKCWNCTNNRPFKESHSRSLAQDILSRNWAGPTTMEGETVNGETIIISRTGQVNSAQHRLVAGVLAYQMWASDSQKHHWKEFWPTEPVLESLVVFGASDNPRVMRTYDNVMPRSLADVFYTSDLFADMSSVGKKECSRILDKAVELLWKRTRYHGKDAPNSYTKYQTHSASLDFVNSHGGQKGKLMEAVHHLYKCDNEKGRVISVILSAGQCAGCLYLMGSSTSDGDEYRNLEPAPSDKVLKWHNWDKAKLFWTDVAEKKELMEPLRIKIGELADEETGVEGKPLEKVCLIAKAWGLYEDNLPLSEDELELEAVYDENGVRHLVERPDFGGIDLGPGEYKEKKISKKAMEAAAMEIRKKAGEEAAAKVEERRKKKSVEEAKKNPLDAVADRAASNLGKKSSSVVTKVDLTENEDDSENVEEIPDDEGE